MGTMGRQEHSIETAHTENGIFFQQAIASKRIINKMFVLKLSVTVRIHEQFEPRISMANANACRINTHAHTSRPQLFSCIMEQANMLFIKP